MMVAKPAIVLRPVATPIYEQEKTASVQLASDSDGGTGLRFSTTKILRPVAEGVQSEVPSYLTRDRDAGQVFVAQRSGTVNHLLMQVSEAEDAFGSDTEGALVFVQWYEVTGTARLNNNRTTEVRVVDWTDDPRADDYLEGEKYRSVGVYRGGVVPKLGAGDWFEIRFTGRAPRVTEGKRYGFLIGFEKPRADQSLGLASLYWGRTGPTDTTVRLNHGIRREGSPQPDPLLFPETIASLPGGAKDVFPPDHDRWWWRPTLPADLNLRLKQTPGTRGRPDVDTWREFAHAVILR